MHNVIPFTAAEYSPLAPLRRGRPAAVSVTLKGTSKRTMRGDPMLVIMPLNAVGGPAEKLMFALEGRGCEIMELGELKASVLQRMGLRQRAAKALIREIESQLLDIRRYGDGNS